MISYQFILYLKVEASKAQPFFSKQGILTRLSSFGLWPCTGSVKTSLEMIAFFYSQTEGCPNTGSRLL
jgi:hypothetical protein